MGRGQVIPRSLYKYIYIYVRAYTRVYVSVRVCTRSFGDYATKNLPSDYNVICGRREARRGEATRRDAPSRPFLHGFPHVNNS